MSAFAGTWRSLWRFHGLLAVILMLEYALTFAVVLTTAGVVTQRFSMIHQPSGIAESGLYVVRDRNLRRIPQDALLDAVQRFAAVAGTSDVALGSGAPFVGFGASAYTAVDVPGQPPATTPLYVNVYSGGMRFARVLGLHIRSGRWFRPDEVVRTAGQSASVVVLSASLARRLFHGQTAVGQLVEYGGRTRTVIGVINPLASPGSPGVMRDTDTLISPELTGNADEILIRYDGQASKLHAVYEHLAKHNPNRVAWGFYPYATLRAFHFRTDRHVVHALAVVVLIVLITALCGILGLTRYWIEQRRRQIAIRRALGGSKRNIIAHFLGESGLLVVLGLMVGVMLNFVFSAYLGVVHFEGGVATWLISVALVVVLAVVVIYASLRRWLRLDPATLMRVL